MQGGKLCESAYVEKHMQAPMYGLGTDTNPDHVVASLVIAYCATHTALANLGGAHVTSQCLEVT